MQNKSPIYQTQQIREFERLAQERFDLKPSTMMQRAGKAAVDFALRRFPQATKIAIFCGTGNNGGDGYTFAQYAHERGLKTTIWQIGNPQKLTGIAKEAMENCAHHHLPMQPLQEKSDLGHPDLIVDAICGIGLHDDLREETVIAIKKMQHLPGPILSLDVPTGIDADTGRVLGTALHATATLTFIGLKFGLLTGAGIAYTGELALNDLQFPADLYALIPPIAERVHLNSFTPFLKPRTRDWHKGLAGHVLVIGGDTGYTGAPRMSALAAYRVGAGLVTIATRPEHAALMNLTQPEIMVHALTSPEDIIELAKKMDVIVIGPGLGTSAWAADCLRYALESQLPLVVDADGLNLLAEHPLSHENWVLTPHPGEAARLLNIPTSSIQHDRLAAVTALHKQYGGVAVLKGAGSLILPKNSLPALCDKGNPGMATGGMGDILSGVIGGLIAQGIPLSEAAKLGVCLHAAAGDLAAKEGERGMIATDLLPYLRRLSNT